MKKFRDIVVIEAREKAIEEAYIPKELLRKFDITVVNGKVIFRR